MDRDTKKLNEIDDSEKIVRGQHGATLRVRVNFCYGEKRTCTENTSRR